MSVPTELGDLIRAMARRDWGTIDRLTEVLGTTNWHGAVPVIGAAFAIAVDRHFGPEPDLNKVSAFVAQVRDQYQRGKDLPALQLEGLIRAALGEAELLDGIDAEVSFPAQIVILGTLLQDEQWTEAELEEFIREVEETAAQYM
ncbi:hypothetical protein O7623_20510 [Solwaraspora sp. WMMD791]|uniref:hypothetical protein n=1 Tax=Solwaraspora sp. WMMD791 TaxID=3016086 RepID=UPI00249A8BEB|nr:hypothetical protein [Solwaraspora sp. WMMD791]WFE25741.1 hypothetical protein O7623_20510 [Solwaraspora sp. WMMD791]